MRESAWAGNLGAMSEAAAGEEGYSGGIGGKFRRRPFRRAPATPYDRPPAAARGIRGNAAEAAAAAAVGGRNGWLSKLVDPASRLITRGATRFFSSVFQKRLGAPPTAEAPVASCERRQVVPDLVNTNPLPEIPERGSKDDSELRNNSKDDGISELEQLLKQKSFTRAEFDHLTELLRSRTVDLPVEDAKKGIEPRTLLPAGDYKKEAEITLGQENEIESSKFAGTISIPASALKIPGEEIASPAEVAKAYMGSRPSKMSLSSSLRNQTIREATVSPSFISFAPKPSAEPVSSKSVNRLPGVPGYSENGYMASRSRGRSAIYKMSRSPYFKSPSTITLKGSDLAEDGISGPSTSNQWMSTNLALSGGKQVLKRRSSVIESDIGSFGPIRRIRQKSNLASPSKDMTLLYAGKFLPPIANTSDNVQTPTLSVEVPLPSHEPKFDTPHRKAAENGDERSCYLPVPPQSSEMARKILQQLDKLVPSPKEKSSEVKTISRHESPSKLTLGMLHGQALKSVAEIDSSKMFNVETNGKLDGSDFSRPGSSISPKQEKVKENGLLKSSSSELKVTSEAKGVDGVLVSVADTRPTKGSVDSIFPYSAAGALQKKPAFTMQAPEDLLELEDDSNNGRDASGSLATGKAKTEASVKEPMIFISETQVTKKPLPFSSERKLASNITLSKEAGKGVTDRSAVAAKDTGFTFQVASPQSQPPLMPTMPSPTVEKSALSSEQVTAPIFTFSSKTTPLTFSSSMTSFTEPSSLKFGAKSELKGQLFGSTMTPTTVMNPVESDSGKSDTTQKRGDLSKSVGPASSSALMTSTASNTFLFAPPTISSHSNGSLASTSSIFSVSAAPAASISGGSVGAIISVISASASTSSGASIASSTSPAVTFQFGSISAVSTDSVSSAVKSGSTSLGPEPVKESPFGIVSSTAATPSSMGISIFGFGASASSSASSTAGSMFGSQVTKSGSGTSPFSQSMMSQFGPNSSPAFGLAGSSLGFGSSAFGSSTSSTKPFVSSSGFGQSSATPSLAVADSLSAPSSSSFTPSVTSPSLFGSSSQSTTSSIFGSVFGSSFSTSTMFTSATSSTASATTPFGSSSSPLTFTSSAAATSSAFIFTQATTTSSPALSFTSFGTTTSSAALSPAVPAFGMPTPAVSFGSGSPGNDQMNVEESMADDTVQSAMPSIPTFGQLSNVPGPNIPFGSPATPSGAPIFQFATPPFPNAPLQGTGSLDFGGGFSIGSGGDKPGRRFIKAKRDKHRKK